jgi:hypothetical protein
MTGADWIGAIGVTILLLAFVLNTQGRLSAESRTYHAMNAVGAAMSCTASVLIEYLPFIILEGMWGSVALLSVLRSLRSPDGKAPALAH